MDCFVASLLAMTNGNVLATNFVRVLPITAPINRRAQGMPGVCRTRSLACKCRKHASKSPQVRRNSPAFPARWFYGLFRALLGVPGLLASVACYSRLQQA